MGRNRVTMGPRKPPDTTTFDVLLLTCLISGTSYGESGNRVHVSPRSGENVLFFVIDERSNESSTLRRDLQIDGNMCDLVIYYKSNNKKSISFVELKGRDLQIAVRQVS